MRCLNSEIDLDCLILSGTSAQILGPLYVMVSVPLWDVPETKMYKEKMFQIFTSAPTAIVGFILDIGKFFMRIRL